jgi:hypothetical protein
MNIEEIKNEELDQLNLDTHVNLINSDEYKRYFLSPSGMEHYRLLSFISSKYDNVQFLDIGSLKGCSALAFSTNQSNKVVSIDIGSHLDLTSIPENIEFLIDDVLDEKHINTILNSKVILFDTFHDGSFEIKFHKHLIDINYQGLVLYDDIHLNTPMLDFWLGIELKKLDISDIGHITGTGLVFYP